MKFNKIDEISLDYSVNDIILGHDFEWGRNAASLENFFCQTLQIRNEKIWTQRENVRPGPFQIKRWSR